MGEAHARIVLWGIEGSGKSTTLRTIHARLRPESRGELVRTPSRLDPTIYSESLAISLGEMGGKPMQIEIVAVPGADDQAMTRKQLLDQVDGVILVLDCAPGRIEANASAIDELRSSLADYGQRLDAFPIVLQYNKRDVADPFAIEALHRRIGLPQAAVFETIATTGHGVLPTLTTISKHVVRLRRDGTRPPTSSSTSTSTAPRPQRRSDRRCQTHEILEAGILAEADRSDSGRRDDGAELEFDRTTQPDWNAVQQELDKPEPALGRIAADRLGRTGLGRRRGRAATSARARRRAGSDPLARALPSTRQGSSRGARTVRADAPASRHLGRQRRIAAAAATAARQSRRRGPAHLRRRHSRRPRARAESRQRALESRRPAAGRRRRRLLRRAGVRRDRRRDRRRRAAMSARARCPRRRS